MALTKQKINFKEFRAQLARLGWPQWKIAAKLGCAPSTFSRYLHSEIKPPDNLVQRIETILGLPAGHLSKSNN